MERSSRIKWLRAGRGQLHEASDRGPYRDDHLRRHARRLVGGIRARAFAASGYVWHASVFAREVWNGLERIGFLYPQQLIWNKGRTVLTRTHYWYQHEPCLYMRKKNAPWFGKARRKFDSLGCGQSEIYNGRFGRREVRSPDAETDGGHAAADPQSHFARRKLLPTRFWAAGPR